MPQPKATRQSQLNDSQMLQRQIMFKQLQELQRRQQFQELGEARQQNYINQQSMINRQASATQFPPLINGTPIHDASQMFMVGNMRSPVVQGFSNGLAFSQAQSQAMRSMGLVSQQHDVSLYGTPIPSAGNNFSQYSHFQGSSHDSASVLTKGNNNQAEKPTMQSSALRNSFLSDQSNVSPNKVRMLDGAYISKQVFEKNLFGQVPTQDHIREVVPSQGLASLDPLEQKILFNMDDESWEASFGSRNNTGTRGFENTLEHTDHLSAFPSVQSGSWSALMQSAVAEASSSDTGLQEEWSGLSFQNPELSTDNQPSNFMDSGKQQTNWVDNNLQSASSLSSKPELMFNNSNSSSSPVFPQSGIPFSLIHRDGMNLDNSHESIHQSPKSDSRWLNSNPQYKQPTEVSPAVQRFPPLQSSWPGQNYEHSESDAHHQNTSSAQLCYDLAGNSDGTTYKDPDSSQKTDNNHVAGSFSDLVGGMEQVKSGKVSTVFHAQNSQLNHFTAVPKSSTTKVDYTIDQETIRRVLESNQLNYMKPVDTSVNDEHMENDQHRLSNSPQIFLNSCKGGSETYKKRENSFQRENSVDSYHSNTSRHTITGHELRENAWLHESDSRLTAEGTQKQSGQVLCQQVNQGPSDHVQGHVGQFKFIGNVSYGGMDIEKGRLPDIRKNLKESEDVSPRSNVRSAGFDGPNTTAQTSQNMLELLHKVDKSTEYRPGMQLGFMDSTSSEGPQAETPDASITQSYNKSSASQYFGLRLAPPSQRLPNSNYFDSSQSSPRMANAAATSPSGPYVRNQLQNQLQSAAPVANQSPQTTLPGMGSRFPAFNPTTSQDTSHRIWTNPHGQQFPILGSMPVTQPFVTSGMSQQVGFSMRPPNVWTNVPTQQNKSGTEPRKVPLISLPFPDSTNSSLETASRVPQELHNQPDFKRGKNSWDIGAFSMNAQGFKTGGEELGKKRSVQQISSGIPVPVPQTGKFYNGQESVANHPSEANAITSGTSMTSSHQQGFDRAWHSDNQSPEISARNLEAFGHSLKPSHVPPQNYSQLHQIHSVKNVDADPIKRVSEKYSGVDSDQNVQWVTAIAGQQSMYGPNSGVKNLLNSELNAMSQLNDSQSHSISSNVASNRTEQTPSWFKNYATLKNGQMMSINDAMFAKNAAKQFSIGKPSENLGMNSSMVLVNSAGASQVSSVWPTTATTSVAVRHLSPPYTLTPNVTDQNLAVLRPKKRKIAPLELLPWHKEVIQGSQRLQTISTAELEWAQAANRLIEKVGYEAETIEDMLPMVRAKKRLILTTELMQQLFRPAPRVILSEDATSNSDIVAYFSARLTLGDACSLTSNSHMRCDIYDMSSEKPEPSERFGYKDFSKIVEDLINRSKRLEGDLLRLDKRGSILDVSVECQELERFSVINRFAKFHTRGQASTSETLTSSGTTPTVPKSFLQRYITALPMPTTVPEWAQCLSL